MTDADITNDPALLANTPSKFQLHSTEPAAESIDFNLNIIKTEFMCFKQEVTICTFRGKPLKLVDQFIYLGSNILSTDIYVNIHPLKVWTVIEGLAIIWKCDLFDKQRVTHISGGFMLHSSRVEE